MPSLSLAVPGAAIRAVSCPHARRAAFRLPAVDRGDGNGDTFVSTAVDGTIKVVGCGGIGIDYLASVASFPKPDDKLRTQALQVQGGGNAGNALTAAARLGLAPCLISKIGDDALADQIVAELEADGVDCRHVLHAEGFSSPFTYIIVDREGGTRTCIHTPGDPLRPEEISEELTNDLLQDARLVYFDGRLTEGAVRVAACAKALGIPLLVEAERLRPKLDELLLMADYVTTSAHFPHDWTGEEHLGNAMLTMMARLPNVRFLTTTLGAKGSVLLTRPEEIEEMGAMNEPVVLQDYLDETFDEVSDRLARSRNGQACFETMTSKPSEPTVDAIGAGNVPIRSGIQISSQGPLRLVTSDSTDSCAVREAAALAAQRAAKNNADFANHEGYTASVCEDEDVPVELIANVLVASAALLDREAVFDTTGAGDAYTGSLIYGLVTGMEHGRMLRLASLVAAANCTALGARLGLPQRKKVRPEIL